MNEDFLVVVEKTKSSYLFIITQSWGFPYLPTQTWTIPRRLFQKLNEIEFQDYPGTIQIIQVINEKSSSSSSSSS